MTRWNVNAVVLGSDPLGESDRLVRFFTPGQGRISAVAKGALRSRVRFVGLFDAGQLVEAGFLLAPRSGRIMVEHARLINGFSALRQNPARLARASLLVEIASMSAPEHHPCRRAFSTVREGLLRIDSEPDSDRYAVVYAFRLLAVLGYRPALDGCVCCRKDRKRGKLDFSASAGGILCPSCRKSGYETGPLVPISRDTMKTLCAVLDADTKVLPRIRLTRNVLAQSIDILDHFIAHQLVRPSRALDFLKRMH